MTREEAKEMFRNDKDSYGKPKAIMSKIDKIFDDFEEEKEEIYKMINDRDHEDKNIEDD